MSAGGRSGKFVKIKRVKGVQKKRVSRARRALASRMTTVDDGFSLGLNMDASSDVSDFSSDMVGESLSDETAIDLTSEQSGNLPAQDHIHEWVELFPSGISVGTEMGRPVLVLKDKSGSDVLPVWMHPLDAGVALADLAHRGGASPHSVGLRVLEALELKLDTCTFSEIIGHHQFVILGFRGGKAEGTPLKSLRMRADEAMSFCIQARARFFSTREFMAQCRGLDIELSKLEHNIINGSLPALQSEIEISSKKHPYVM